MKVEVMKITKLIVVSLMMVFATGCASHAGVVPMNQGNFMMTKQAATESSDIGNLKAEVMKEAESFCNDMDKNMSVLSYDETKPPYIIGNFPRVELQFSCLIKPFIPEQSGRKGG